MKMPIYKLTDMMSDFLLKLSIRHDDDGYFIVCKVTQRIHNYNTTVN